MDIRRYQLQAAITDQVPGKDDESLMVPLLGLAGETGSLLTEYKKHLRDGDAYRLFKEKIIEELGDILWYVSNIATKAELNLEDVAQGNLAKVHDRWRRIDDETQGGPGPKLFDDGFPPDEQLPRHFTIRFSEVRGERRVKLQLMSNGAQVGNDLTDNAYDEDGYRFHDVFHLAYAAVLGWSPVTRKLLKRKRRSKSEVDEVEDGGRAIVIEEAISVLVFNYAKGHSFLQDINAIDYEVLRLIKNLSSHLEVQRCAPRLWESAILEGFNVWRQVQHHRGGLVTVDMIAKTIEYSVKN